MDRRGKTAHRNKEVTTHVKMSQVDNYWDFPNFPTLTRIVEIHLNAEIFISSVGFFKYLFKNVCKGSDRVRVEIIGDNMRTD